MAVWVQSMAVVSVDVNGCNLNPLSLETFLIKHMKSWNFNIFVLQFYSISTDTTLQIARASYSHYSKYSMICTHSFVYLKIPLQNLRSKLGGRYYLELQCGTHVPL